MSLLWNPLSRSKKQLGWHLYCFASHLFLLLLPTLLLALIALGIDRLHPIIQSSWPSYWVPRNTRISGETAGKERGNIARKKAMDDLDEEEK